ncbi:MAG: amidase [Streptomycetales bacterium]
MRTDALFPRDLECAVSVVSQRLRDGALSSHDLTRSALERIEAHNPRLNAVVTLLADSALDAARKADREIHAGRWRGPLHGVPVGLKDIIETGGVRTTMGSEFYRDHLPAHDADVVRRLRRAGAVVIGKLHTHEFAYGPTGDASCFGPVRNPHDPDRVAGGSSGGSAVAVATGMCAVALGSDTGGSIRIPAALCGAVGMKPTFGRISRQGVFPLSWTLDHVGPISRTVEDNALLLAVLSGYDRRDPGSVRRAVGDVGRDIRSGVRGRTIGVPDQLYFDHLDAEVAGRVQGALRAWEELGASVRPVSIPALADIREAQRSVLAVEAYSVHRHRLEQHPELFGSAVRQRLQAVRSSPAWVYAEARRMRAAAREGFDAALAEVDVLAAPTVPLQAPLLGQEDTDTTGLHESVRSALTRLTGPTNLTGHPSLSLPCGHSVAGLPVGVQLIGRAWDEAMLYRFGWALERRLFQEPAGRTVAGSPEAAS